MTTNAAGLALIESFEGDELRAYRDGGGVWTDGYGHTAGVKPGDVITQAQALAYLKGDVAGAEHAVSACVRVALSGNQFAALVSFEYNTGGLAGSAGLPLLNAGQFALAWDEHFCLWIHDAAGNIEPGLIRRRAAERALFFTPGG